MILSLWFKLTCCFECKNCFISNKDFTKHQPFDDEYFDSEYRLCGIKSPLIYQFNLESEMDWEQQEEEDTQESELW